jgi:4-hydroxy-2-oxoheptanedioate aldolase
MGYGGTKAYVQALRDIVVAIMIEKPGTVDTLEDVLSVKGVDMVQWGGSDYSMGIGRAGERYSPELRVVERPRVRNGHQDGRAAPRRDRHRDQAKYFPRTWASATSPSAPTSPSCTSGGSPG